MKDICKKCNGKGNPFCPYNSGFCPKDKKPQTNEEWFCFLPTEEKAKVFVDIAQNDFYALRIQYYGEANDNVDAFTMWLKEKHVE